MDGDSRVNEQMLNLQFGKLVGKYAGGDITPEPGRIEHVGLVD